MAYIALIVALVALIISLRPRAETVEREIERRQAARRKPKICDDVGAAHMEARQAREAEKERETT